MWMWKTNYKAPSAVISKMTLPKQVHFIHAFISHVSPVYDTIDTHYLLAYHTHFSFYLFWTMHSCIQVTIAILSY